TITTVAADEVISEGTTCGCAEWCQGGGSPFGVCSNGPTCFCTGTMVTKEEIGDRCTCDAWCWNRDYHGGDYTQSRGTTINVNEFAFVNKVPHFSDTWHDGVPDHTENDDYGYMFLLNVRGQKDAVLFRSNVRGLCVGQLYKFSAYLANVNKKDTKLVKPNVRFQVQALGIPARPPEYKDTDDIPECNHMNWLKYCLSFNASSSIVGLSMTLNAVSDDGNNIAIDDIKLRRCPNQNCGSCPAG
ncbi:unnamed protein product, partial [Adineta steineri]